MVVAFAKAVVKSVTVIEGSTNARVRAMRAHTAVGAARQNNKFEQHPTICSHSPYRLSENHTKSDETISKTILKTTPNKQEHQKQLYISEQQSNEHVHSNTNDDVEF